MKHSKHSKYFCRARRLGMRLQAALRESNLHRSVSKSTTLELNPIPLLSESADNLLSQKDRRRRSLAPSPELTTRQS
jgi:hypothetical protein